MSQERILNAIADACEDKSLRFQLIVQDSSLHIYINRPYHSQPDYHQLKYNIYSVIKELPVDKFQQIWLYCRILGEFEPDWQSVLEIEPRNLLQEQQLSGLINTISEAVESTNTIVTKIEQQLELEESFADDESLDFEDLPTAPDEEPELFELSEAELAELLEDSIHELDLSKYCFIRNRRLLYAVLDPPWENIARLVYSFDRFDPGLKRSLLPMLDAFFDQEIRPNQSKLGLKAKAWWQAIITLDSDHKHKLGIWLSRYCQNSQETMIAVESVLTNQVITAYEQAELLAEIDTARTFAHNDQTPANQDSPSGLVNRNSEPESQSGLRLNIRNWLIQLRKFLNLS